jgi:hypothetical protein
VLLQNIVKITFHGNTRRSLLRCSLFCLLLAGCTSQPETDKKLISTFPGTIAKIVDNDEGLLHGISLGMPVEEVKKKSLPGDSLSSASDNYLFYEAMLDSLAEYTYECEFDEKGLRALTLMIYRKGETQADALFADFKNYFTKKYGQPEDMGFGYIWNAPAGKRPARITLKDESTEYLYGVISVSFYDSAFEARPTAKDSLSL